MADSTIYLGLGSNLGDRDLNIKKAIEMLSEKIQMEQVSSIYETEPVGYADQPHFLNAVCKAHTSLEPGEVLDLAKEIEASLGRKTTFRNGPRIVDIDLLLYDNQVLDTPMLTVPHPRLEERAFVLVPLAELAPELVHPTRRKKISQLLDIVDQAGIKRWDGGRS